MDESISISLDTARVRGLVDPAVTSTPAPQEDDVIEVKILVSDGVGGRVRSDMLLHYPKSEITDVTRGSCVISRLGVEGPWCRKEGPNKYLPEYLDTQAGLNKIFDQVRKHRKQQSKNKTSAPDPNMVVRNLPGSDVRSGAFLTIISSIYHLD